MPKPAPAAPAARAARGVAPTENRITELKVSGHLMKLDTGLFCIVQTPSKAADARTGLPGVRVSLPPGPASRRDMVEISTFHPDGWMSGFGDAALVRVFEGPAQVMVTIYQAPNVTDGAPNLQVVKLMEQVPARPRPQAVAGGEAAAVAEAAPAPAVPPQPTVVDMLAHIQGRGDIGARLGEWLGEPGSKQWIEGMAVAPAKDIAPDQIEYQAVLGRGWLSPWVEGGQFCGSRGMALPLLGFRLRLRGDAARDFECSYSASFTDGTTVGPVAGGESCESESLSPMEAFQISIHRRGEKPTLPAARPKAAPAAAPAPAPAARPRRK
jgi:hypothetical protein